MEASAQPLTAPRPAPKPRTLHAGPLIGVIAQVLLLAALAATVGLSAGGWVVGLSCAVIMDVALEHGLTRYAPDGFRTADWVTLARGSLAVSVAALVADSFSRPAPVALLVSISALAHVLDLVDGRARWGRWARISTARSTRS
jgi:hypothetical protein